MAVDISKLHLYWGAYEYKGKTYKSYSLARAVRHEGKNRKEVILSLGKLSDDEVKHWKMALSAAKGADSGTTSLNGLRVRANYAHLDSAVALEVWRSWGLDQVFARTSNHNVSLAAVAATLAINRCIDPASKSAVCSWFPKTTLPFMLGLKPDQINPSRIFRELDAIEELKPELCDYLYKEHIKRDPDAMKSVFYDLSSTTFSGTKCLLMGWGHCKEGYENHMVLALVVNQKGLPVWWSTLPGNTADVTTIDWLMLNLQKRFKIAAPTLVFDRGMVSSENLSLLEDKQVHYVSAMDRNQLESISGVNFSQLTAIEGVETVKSRLMGSGKFVRFDDSTYFYEVPVRGSRRYVLCFSPQLFEDQRNARQLACSRFMRFVKRENRALIEAQKSRGDESTLKKFTEALSREHLEECIELVLKKRKRGRNTGSTWRTVHTFECLATVNEEKMLEKGRLDGFWMLVTNQTDTSTFSTEQLIRSYKDKVIIESSFRDIKSFVEVSPVHVWTIDHVKAHYTLCVLAHLINRTLDLALKDKPGDASQDIISHPRLFEELSSCHLNHLEDKSGKLNTLTVTQPTPVQRELLARIGFTHILKEEFNSKFLPKSAKSV